MLDDRDIWDDSSRTAHRRNRGKGQPFLAVVNLILTHESSVTREEITRVQASDVVVPPYLPDTLEVREDLARYYTASDRMDDYVRRFIEQLREDGLLEDTIVVFSSDHGSGLPRSKRFLYDEGVHVPLIIRVPDRFSGLSVHKAGARVAAPVQQASSSISSRTRTT